MEQSQIINQSPNSSFPWKKFIAVLLSGLVLIGVMLLLISYFLIFINSTTGLNVKTPSLEALLLLIFLAMFVGIALTVFFDKKIFLYSLILDAIYSFLLFVYLAFPYSTLSLQFSQKPDVQKIMNAGFEQMTRQQTVIYAIQCAGILFVGLLIGILVALLIRKFSEKANWVIASIFIVIFLCISFTGMYIKNTEDSIKSANKIAAIQNENTTNITKKPQEPSWNKTLVIEKQEITFGTWENLLTILKSGGYLKVVIENEPGALAKLNTTFGCYKTNLTSTQTQSFILCTTSLKQDKDFENYEIQIAKLSESEYTGTILTLDKRGNYVGAEASGEFPLSKLTLYTKASSN